MVIKVPAAAAKKWIFYLSTTTWIADHCIEVPEEVSSYGSDINLVASGIWGHNDLRTNNT
jgi:hypothetical protein